MDKVLLDSLKEFAYILDKNNVEYMFVGGVAVAFYATERPSSNMPKGIDYDVDIWYSATISNFTKLSKAIIEFNPELKEDIKKFIFTPTKAFLRFSIKNIQFEFLPELSAFTYKDFSKCFQDRSLYDLDGIPFSFIAKEGLILNKQTTARPKDKLDITNLNKNSYKGFSR